MYINHKRRKFDFRRSNVPEHIFLVTVTHFHKAGGNTEVYYQLASAPNHAMHLTRVAFNHHHKRDPATFVEMEQPQKTTLEDARLMRGVPEGAEVFYVGDYLRQKIGRLNPQQKVLI